MASTFRIDYNNTSIVIQNPTMEEAVEAFELIKKRMLALQLVNVDGSVHEYEFTFDVDPYCEKRTVRAAIQDITDWKEDHCAEALSTKCFYMSLTDFGAQQAVNKLTKAGCSKIIVRVKPSQGNGRWTLHSTTF